MIMYVILILTICLFQNPFTSKQKNEKMKLFFSMSILFIFAAIRGNGDGDYFTYLSYSKLITDTSQLFNDNFPMEFGFRLISYLVNAFSLDSQFVIAIMNLISITFIYLFIKEYSCDKLFSVFLFLPFYFLYDMHASRTAVALAIGTYGLKYILKKNFIRYLFVIFIAAQFHSVALILIFLYFLNYIKRSSFFYISSILFFIVIFKTINVESVILYILKFINLSSLAHRFEIYMNSEQYGYSFSLLDPRFLLATFILLFSFYVIEIYKKTSENNDLKLERLLIKINWLTVCSMIIFNQNTLVVIRLYGLLNIYSIIQIPLIIKMYFEKSKTNDYIIIKILFLIVYLIYCIFIIKNYPPYKVFF